LAKRKKIFLIEDCAHVPFFLYKNKPVGLIGDAAFFSFQNRKMITGFGGGFIVTKHKKLYLNCKKFIENNSFQFFSFIPKLVLYYLELILTSKLFYFIYFFIKQNISRQNFILKVYHYVHHKNVEKRKNLDNYQARLIIEQINNCKRLFKSRFMRGQLYNRLLNNKYVENQIQLIIIIMHIFLKPVMWSK
jgi:dTDP-4-amino-4,6-dideoxygalactose transaminase